MANLETTEPAVFTPELRQLETTDPGHADIFNVLFAALLTNDKFLNEVAAQIQLVVENHLKDFTLHMSTDDKAKLANISSGAEVNQNAYAKVVAGGITIEANGKTSTLNFEAGDNVTIAGDNANKKLTIGVTLPSTMTPSAHNQSASTVTAGTLAGKVLANATAAATVTNKQVRNIYAGTSAMTAGTTALTSGDVYAMYE